MQPGGLAFISTHFNLLLVHPLTCPSSWCNTTDFYLKRCLAVQFWGEPSLMCAESAKNGSAHFGQLLPKLCWPSPTSLFSHWIHSKQIFDRKLQSKQKIFFPSLSREIKFETNVVSPLFLCPKRENCPPGSLTKQSCFVE